MKIYLFSNKLYLARVKCEIKYTIAIEKKLILSLTVKSPVFFPKLNVIFNYDHTYISASCLKYLKNRDVI